MNVPNSSYTTLPNIYSYCYNYNKAMIFYEIVHTKTHYFKENDIQNIKAASNQF